MIDCNCGETQTGKMPYVVNAALAVVVVGLFLMLHLLGIAGKPGDLADSDGYLHLLRAEELYRTRQWYDPVIDRVNTPYGDELHWTRPFDVLLLAGAIPASLATDFDTALLWWGVAISPVLFGIALLLLPWTVRPLLGDDGALIAGFLLIFQWPVLSSFMPGRPDHHSLLILLFVLLTGFTLRLIRQTFNLADCYGAAGVAALSVWASIESTLPVATVFAALAILWVVRDGDFARKAAHFSTGLFVLTSISLFIERPWGNLMAVEFDRLASVHVVAFGAMALLWWVVVSVSTGRAGLVLRRTHRAVGLIAGIALLTVIMGLLFPGAYRGPFADVHPDVARVYVRNVAEMKPLLSSDSRFSLGVPLLGGILLCAPLLLRRSTRGPDRAGWIYVSFGLVLFALISFLQRRWTPYVGVLLALPLAAMITAIWSRLDRRPLSLLRTLQKTGVLIVPLAFLTCSGVFAESLFGGQDPKGPKVSVRPVCNYLEAAPVWQDRDYRILTHLFWGGEILYRTHHAVVGTPYHRNARGILDTHRVLSAPTDEEAWRVIRERRVDLILLAPQSRDGCLYCADTSRRTFYARLRDAEIPDWCESVLLRRNSLTFCCSGCTNSNHAEGTGAHNDRRIQARCANATVMQVAPPETAGSAMPRPAGHGWRRRPSRRRGPLQAQEGLEAVPVSCSVRRARRDVRDSGLGGRLRCGRRPAGQQASEGPQLSLEKAPQLRRAALRHRQHCGDRAANPKHGVDPVAAPLPLGGLG